MQHQHRFILTLSCPDVRGIVHQVTGFLASHNGFILESAQFGDESTERFFMRVDFALDEALSDLKMFKQAFQSQIAGPFNMQWHLVPKEQKSRVLIMVSQYGHCLHDLLYRHSTKQLPIEVAAIVSNHSVMESIAAHYQIPFHYWPVDEKSKAAQEKSVLGLMEKEAIDLLILARYMQILSPAMCEAVAGRAINIHHSFLPSFKGAKPYQQAYTRGVKLIGATAHYVTTDLDEGPIIEQEVARVDHTHTPDELSAIGRDIECSVLARAAKYHSEHRVFLNGQKTVVFR
ncbi:MAG: formyltetrahydrofolate deformylase [Rickettsiales bacterium]|jgi:formyltetrahydrofolate deformylase|nr:formyltetrahydrofolate deformylase [Rickettsiales bacterium]